MATKVIKIATNGTQSEYAGIASSAGAGSSGEFPVLDGSGKLDPTFMPTGIGSDAITATSGEALAAGDFVYISATGTILKADATAPAKAARGYILAAVANGAQATVYFDDNNTAVAGLTPGATYYLSATAGGVTTTPPTTAGQIVQELGFASSTTSLHVNIKIPVTRA